MQHLVRLLPTVVALSALAGRMEIHAVSNGAEKPARVTVAKIISVHCAFQKRNPPNLVVTATGQVSTTGFSEVRLQRVEHPKPPADGIQDYVLTAVPPAGIVAQVLSQVEASDTWIDYRRDALWLKGVRIHGVGDGTKVQMLMGEE